MMVGNSNGLALLATLLGSLASGALGALVDRSTLRTVSVTGGGAENPSLFHMVRIRRTRVLQRTGLRRVELTCIMRPCVAGSPVAQERQR